MSEYPIERTLAKISGKWKYLIFCFLTTGGKRNHELLKLIPLISQKVLTEQLRQLEKDGIVLRTIHPSVPVSVEYSLTEFGKTLIPVFEVLRQWGGGGAYTTPCEQQQQQNS